MKFNFFCTYFWKAFCMQNPEAREKGMTVSLFRRLSEAHPQAVSALQCQYRMCADIMSLCNALIYGNRLRCGSREVATAQLTLSTPLLKHAPQWLHQVWNFVHNPSVTDQRMISISDLTLFHWDSYCAIVMVVQVLDPCRKVLFLDTGKLKKLNFFPIVFYTHILSPSWSQFYFIFILFYCFWTCWIQMQWLLRKHGCAKRSTMWQRPQLSSKWASYFFWQRKSSEIFLQRILSLSFLSNLMSLEWLGAPYSVQVCCSPLIMMHCGKFVSQ